MQTLEVASRLIKIGGTQPATHPCTVLNPGIDPHQEQANP